MRKFLCALGLFSILILITPLGMAQSLTSGDISGTVTDPSGAVVKDAIVNLKSLDTGAAQTTATGDTGMYRFSLLKPGRYTVKVTQQGFQGTERQVAVNIGQVATANFTLKVGQATEVVEVTGALPVVNVESANISTAYDQREISTLPNPGGDLTNIAQIAPGVVMNTSSVYGYGNFTANGLPGTANVFTVNGENNMDPQFNINNSGATNLSLGQNEMQEATVVSNPYSGQYGQQAGAQVNYITRSGTNTFHGNANYSWNGRAMNANDWFANNSNTPRPFANNNQWAASFGGPIKKDKTFFFVNTEGLRFLLPTVQNVYIPTQEFANAVLANVATVQADSLPLYQKMFKVWLNAPGASRATPLAGGGCEDAVGAIPGITANSVCVNNFIATPGQLSTEWILSGRVDHNFSDNDKVFARYKMDRGLQATYTDPINSNFNATSPQPSYDGQLQWNHVFSGTATNQFIMAGSWYSAMFKQNETQAIDTFPYEPYFYAPIQLSRWGYQANYPQGRNVTQYQFIDDFSKIIGNHTIKVGANFRRYDISDFNFSFFKHPRVYFDSLAGFGSGEAYQFREWFAQNSVRPMAFWGLGVYGQDEWKVSNDLKLTFALRLEHNSNPTCVGTPCVALMNGPFNSLTHGTDVAYNASIQTGLSNAYRGIDALNISPRFGFTWSPFGHANTVISGGFGLFYDSIPASLLETFASNVPYVNEFRVYAGENRPVLWADPGTTGAAAVASRSNQGLLAGFNAGQSFDQIQASIPDFAAPSFYSAPGTMKTPRFQEWNLQIQEALGSKMSVSANYVGNHGIHIPVLNDSLNAYDIFGIYSTLRTAPVDSSFATVGEYTTSAISNYNGLTLSFQRRFANSFSAGANYTWSHAMDEVSNGGITPYALYDSLLGQINPSSLRANNYGNSDYDTRHYFSLYYDWQPSLKFSNSALNYVMNGWVFSGKLFSRTGMPFSVIDGNGYLQNYPLAYPPAQTIGSGAAPGQLSCSTPNHSCLDSAAFVDTANNVLPGFPTQRRNQYRGPGFFDTDLSVTKNFKLYERLNFAVGATFYNLFNHPNFGYPDYYVGDSTFGKILNTVSVPASPYGAFMGSAASPRLVQLNARITF